MIAAPLALLLVLSPGMSVPAAPPLPVVPVTSGSFDASLYNGPTIVTIEGDRDGEVVHGRFARQTSGRWRESNSQMPRTQTFDVVEQTPAVITLFDPSRDLWIKLDLTARTVSYRDTIGAAYVVLYSITDVR